MFLAASRLVCSASAASHGNSALELINGPRWLRGDNCQVCVQLLQELMAASAHTATGQI